MALRFQERTRLKDIGYRQEAGLSPRQTTKPAGRNRRAGKFLLTAGQSIELETLDIRGILPVRVEEGKIGSDAGAIGVAAGLPVSSFFPRY